MPAAVPINCPAKMQTRKTAERRARAAEDMPKMRVELATCWSCMPMSRAARRHEATSALCRYESGTQNSLKITTQSAPIETPAAPVKIACEMAKMTIPSRTPTHGTRLSTSRPSSGAAQTPAMPIKAKRPISRLGRGNALGRRLETSQGPRGDVRVVMVQVAQDKRARCPESRKDDRADAANQASLDEVRLGEEVLSSVER